MKENVTDQEKFINCNQNNLNSMNFNQRRSHSYAPDELENGIKSYAFNVKSIPQNINFYQQIDENENIPQTEWEEISFATHNYKYGIYINYLLFYLTVCIFTFITEQSLKGRHILKNHPTVIISLLIQSLRKLQNLHHYETEKYGTRERVSIEIMKIYLAIILWQIMKQDLKYIKIKALLKVQNELKNQEILL